MPPRETTTSHHDRTSPASTTPRAEDVLEGLERVLASEDFDESPRSRAFLRFIVEETVAGRQESLTQAAIAVRVFARREGFDPTIDPIVRIQAGRLRRSLERHYLLAGSSDPVRIGLPRGTYVPVLRWATDPRTGAKAVESPPAPVDDWPTVVAGIESVGPDAELGDTAARYLHHLSVELSRYRDVHVVPQPQPAPPGPSPGGGAMFALTARLSREEASLRLIARLVDCRTGGQVWAEEYRAGPATPGAFPEETARVIAAAVASEQGVVAKRLWAERRTRPPTGLTPYGGILASYQFFFNRDPADLAPAIEALKQVVAAEPECALAWVQLGRLYTANFAFDIAPVETPIDQAVTFAQKGVRIDPSSQRARAALGFALLVKGETAAGLVEIEYALALNPETFVYLEAIGWLLTLLGEWDRGAALVRKAIGRNPHHMPVAHNALCVYHLRRGEYDMAYQEALLYRDSAFFWRSAMRACCLGHLGRPEEARVEVAELLAKKPDFATRGRTLIGRMIKFPDLEDRIADGLAKAGLLLG